MLLDTSAWIEFFLGTSSGRRVKAVLEGEDCYTSIVSLAEVSNWAFKEGRDAAPLVKNIGQLSNVIDLGEDIAVLAGQINFERKKTDGKWGMLDSFILATGSIYELKILTKDRDFKDLPDIELL